MCYAGRNVNPFNTQTHLYRNFHHLRFRVEDPYFRVTQTGLLVELAGNSQLGLIWGSIFLCRVKVNKHSIEGLKNCLDRCHTNARQGDC